MGGRPAAAIACPRGVSIRKLKHGDRIQIAFSFQGAECRELLPPGNITKSAIQYAAGLRLEILRKIEDGEFRYSDYFPDSPKAKTLAGCRCESGANRPPMKKPAHPGGQAGERQEDLTRRQPVRVRSAHPDSTSGREQLQSTLPPRVQIAQRLLDIGRDLRRRSGHIDGDRRHRRTRCGRHARLAGRAAADQQSAGDHEGPVPGRVPGCRHAGFPW